MGHGSLQQKRKFSRKNARIYSQKHFRGTRVRSPAVLPLVVAFRLECRYFFFAAFLAAFFAGAFLAAFLVAICLFSLLTILVSLLQ
jgi:hypothetical protein